MDKKKVKTLRRSSEAKAVQGQSTSRRSLVADIVCTDITTDTIQPILNYDETDVEYVRILRSFYGV